MHCCRNIPLGLALAEEAEVDTDDDGVGGVGGSFFVLASLPIVKTLPSPKGKFVEKYATREGLDE